MNKKEKELQIIKLAGLNAKLKDIAIDLDKLNVENGVLLFLMIITRRLDAEVESRTINIKFEDIIKDF